MGPRDDRSSLAAHSEPDEGASRALSTARLRSVTLALMVLVQLSSVLVIWLVPELRLQALCASGIACVIGLVTLQGLSSSLRRSIEHSARIRVEAEQSRARSITRLAEQLQPVLKGDLRVRAAETRHGETDALARILNHTVTELRWLVGQCHAYSERIDSLLEDPRRQLHQLNDAYKHQASETHESANALASMSNVVASLGEATRSASGKAGQAAESADVAAQIASGNHASFAGMQQETDRARRTLHRLSRSASAVDGQLGSIFEVARRADLLALNSTLQVSTHASGNTELSQLSEEVADLASVLNRASSEIGLLAGSIHQDAVDAVAAMTQGSKALAGGIERFGGLTDALSAVVASCNELRGEVDDMARHTLLQTSAAGKVYARMQAINDSAGLSLSHAQSWSHTLDELQALALELRSSVADFRLPPIPSSIEPPTGEARSNGVAKGALSDV